MALDELDAQVDNINREIAVARKTNDADRIRALIQQRKDIMKAIRLERSANVVEK